VARLELPEWIDRRRRVAPRNQQALDLTYHMVRVQVPQRAPPSVPLSSKDPSKVEVELMLYVPLHLPLSVTRNQSTKLRESKL
jgi:hypothetical protein